MTEAPSILASASRVSHVRIYRCPIQGCATRFSSQPSLDIHKKYFHGANSTGVNANEETGVGNSPLESDAKRQKREMFFCQEEECFKIHGRNKLFKNYSTLKQHYMAAHAKKIYECEKCSKKFSELSKKKQHQLNCGIKITCSCGIAYHGKRGFLAHIKSTKHECPENAKKYFIKKRPALPEKVKKRTVTNSIASKKIPVPILPKGGFPTPSFYISKPISVVPTTTQVPPGNTYRYLNANTKKRYILPVKPPVTYSRLQSRGRFVIDVIRPSKSCSTPNSSNCDRRQTTTSVAPEVSRTDSLSTATTTSRINCSSIRKFSNITVQDGLSKTSQTDWSGGNPLTAQDCSCQTDEFLTWLDSAFARCDPTTDSSTVNICTQTSESSGFQEICPSFQTPNQTISVSRDVTQHETQTDDDWINALFQDAECESSSVTNAESQTADFFSHGSLNENANNNHPSFYTGLPEQSCDIETQTGVADFTSHVMTQTTVPSSCVPDSFCIGDPLLKYIASDNQTQTDDSPTVGTAYTQTTWHCDDLTQFLNIETQTDT